MDDDKLSESQRRIVATMTREMVGIAGGIKAEIEKLRQEQQSHEQGVHDSELEHIRQEVKRKALGLLG